MAAPLKCLQGIHHLTARFCSLSVRPTCSLKETLITPVINRQYSSLPIVRTSTISPCQNKLSGFQKSTPQNEFLTKIFLPICQPARTKTMVSIRKGKEKTVKAVVRRFKRLAWGAWIRPRAGRGKRRWQKSSSRKRSLDQHVFCNSTQSKLLDKMVTGYWRKHRHYPNDPYGPYHKRTNMQKYVPPFLP